MKLHPRNLSSGDKGTWMGSCCRALGLRRLSNASWDSNVGMAAAQALCGRILDGGLITGKYQARLNELNYSKTCLKWPLKKDQKFVFKTNYRLMQAKSIAECSKGSILQYF